MNYKTWLKELAPNGMSNEECVEFINKNLRPNDKKVTRTMVAEIRGMGNISSTDPIKELVKGSYFRPKGVTFAVPNNNFVVTQVQYNGY